jgi:ankyrin repeat protein
MVKPPLFKACENGNEAIVKDLVENDANINETKDNSSTPLFFCM